MIGLVFPDSLVLQENLEVISEDPLLDQLLQDYGISDLDELVSDQDISRFTGQEKHRFYRRWCLVVDHQNS